MKKYSVSEKGYSNISKFYKIMSDSTRIKIIHLLIDNETLNVGDISKKLEMTKSAISHQLAKMKNLRIVKNEKIGKEVFYSLDDEHISKILNLTLEHLYEKEEL